MNVKKPAKKIRSLLLKKQKKTLDLENLTTTKTFFNLIGIVYVGTALFYKNGMALMRIRIYEPVPYFRF
jgi:hypothetical protein